MYDLSNFIIIADCLYVRVRRAPRGVVVCAEVKKWLVPTVVAKKAKKLLLYKQDGQSPSVVGCRIKNLRISYDMWEVRNFLRPSGSRVVNLRFGKTFGSCNQDLPALGLVLAHSH